MQYDSWFDLPENKAFLAICARKLISNVGIGGIAWGLINIRIGVDAMRETIINAGIVILGVMLLATAVQALRRPSLGVLLAETIIAILLFAWNLGISILNFPAEGASDLMDSIGSLAIAAFSLRYYRKLQHVRELIPSVEPGQIKATKQICKTLVKKKVKNEPTVVRTRSHVCTAQLMDDKALFMQRDLMKAFVASKSDVRNALVTLDANNLRMRVQHPLGQLTYHFDKRNSEKLKRWLSAETECIGTELGQPFSRPKDPSALLRVPG